MRLLITEDHPQLRQLLASHLAHSGYAVDSVGSGQEALTAMDMVSYDALVLDLGLPDIDGMQVLARCNSRAGRVPCLVLTARDALESRIQALNAGADDYILKPVHMQELEARLRAVLRRADNRHCPALSLGNLQFEPDAMRVLVNGQAFELPRRETMLLEEMLRAAPRIAIKDTLETRLYSWDEPVTLNAIEALVSRLRRKLASVGADIRIDTIRGLGYRLVHSPSS